MSQGVNGHGPQQNSGSLSLVEANAGSRPPMAAATKVNKSWNTRTILRKNRPVLASIPVDVWHNVFACCPLQFLLQARGACPEFRSALLYESFWKQTRLQQYGAEHADPPPGITEVQYADLLVGKGCQNKGCKDTKAKKTYWAFERRWCDPCLATKIIYVRLGFFPELGFKFINLNYFVDQRSHCLYRKVPSPGLLCSPGKI